MRAHGWLGLCFAIAVTAAAFSSCGHSVMGATGTGGGGAAGTGGSGGSGGATPSSSSSGMPEAGPISCTTLYTTIPKGTCDLLQQDCPAGETCEPTPNGSGFTTICVGSTGLKTVGETCYSQGECDAKLFCVDGKCTQVCCHENNEPCDGVLCSLTVTYGSDFMDVCHYAVMCELLTPGACPTGFGCHVEDASQSLATCIQPSGNDAPELGPCKYLNDCGDNQQCFAPNGGTATCHYYCYLGGPTSAPPGAGGCPQGEACVASYDGTSTNEGFSGVGLCYPTGGPADAGDDAGGDDAGGDDAGGDDAGSGDAGSGGGDGGDGG
jgi:hypothetical protein